MSLSAYKKTIKNTESPRDIERRILSQVTSDLEAIKDSVDGAQADDRKSAITPEVRKALWDNQKLWITVKADLMAPENGLTSEIKADLISLAHWVDKQTSEILKGEGVVEPLIEVNRNIINGLSGRA
jgi:flagellar biosynthesis activator protein FlaF